MNNERDKILMSSPYGEYEKIFFEKINKYNDVKDYSEHFILLKDDKLMHITFTHSWTYEVYEIEKED